MAKRGTQQDDEPDGTLVVDLEKYCIPDGTRCVSDLICVCERYCFVISWHVLCLYRHIAKRDDLCLKRPTVLKKLSYKSSLRSTTHLF